MSEMSTREALVKDRLPEISFRRWRILMNKIDSLEEKRRDLQIEMGKLQKQADELYTEMRQLWEHTK